jgi:hypothetical protein
VNPQPNAADSVFGRLTSLHARFLFVAWMLLVVCSVAVTLTRWKSGFAGAPSRGPGDIALYRAKIERIGRGAGYYEAANAELRLRGYPTKSLFNWRTPLPVWFLGRLPDPLYGKALLGGAALIALCLSFAVMERSGGLREALVGGLAMIGALMPSVLGDLFVEPVLWSGVLMTLSLCGYAKRRPGLGVACGLAALFCRELALPYCLLAAVLAGWERRWRELAAWMLGLAAYTAFLAWHASMVFSLMQPTDRAHAEGWVQFGGLPFVISTCQMNAYLLLLPQYVTAIYLSLAVLGFAAWQTPFEHRLGATVGGYLLGLMIVGHDFNQYWGAMLAPLMCFGFARSVTALPNLWRACGWRSGVQLSAGRSSNGPSSRPAGSSV